MYVGEWYGGKGTGERAKRGRGTGGEGAGRRGEAEEEGWNNINYLIKIITEDILFFFFLIFSFSSEKFDVLFASDVCQIRFLTFISLVSEISQIKSDVGRHQWTQGAGGGRDGDGRKGEGEKGGAEKEKCVGEKGREKRKNKTALYPSFFFYTYCYTLSWGLWAGVHCTHRFCKIKAYK